jgi:hypothetical protein
MDINTSEVLIRLLYLSNGRKMSTPFDAADVYDELRDLFATDPAAAEKRAAEIIQSYINTLEDDKKQRAAAFNWRIQQELRNYKDPTARMNKMVELFWNGVKEFQSVLNAAVHHPETIVDQCGNPSEIVRFPTKDR